MRKPTVRIKDVALAAGVSTATVSRALSNPDKVSDETRKNVLAAVDKTGYVLDEAASNFRRQRTGSIVALLPNIANPYYSTILSAISEALAGTGYNLLVVDTNYGRRADDAALQYFTRRRTDGVIVLLGSLPADTLRTALAGPSVPPVIQVGEWPEAPETPRVTIDNREAGRLAARHLIDLGHRDIGFASGPRGNFTTETRLQGLRDVLEEAGLFLREDCILPGEFSLASGRAAAQVWLDMSERPTAVFCDSDEIACGFIGHVTRAGIKVPDQVSVVGFDDIEICAHIYPALTTIHQPRRAIGTTVARMMLDVIEEKPIERENVMLDVDLVLRDSTAPPASAR
ncbi:LacI family DNA-binding transcriptional regulator [Neorhizobium sp. NCHU2750]|uniref:LacI family DNA-binding transcriptional regulator n=1 Tax=Neorhizobium sp. NCHU2750 TaxID=1825976 RepID=UPI000E74A9BD|nr:LacI family transcriptional regulator [Neorhizobium sp. NCHU2750]